MSLTDFWNNITTPGFLSASFDELKEMCTDCKEEMTELFEEGEEIFTDGFHEMVIKDNNEYRTSANKREDGRKEIKAVQQELLKARGVSDQDSAITDVLCHDLENIIEKINEFDTQEIEFVCNALQSEFSQVVIKTPDELTDRHQEVLNILKMPELPSDETALPKETIKNLGPLNVALSDKQKRIKAADKYLETVEAYKGMMKLEIEKQEHNGLLFNTLKITEDGKELILDFGKCCWDVIGKYNTLGLFTEVSAAEIEAERRNKLKHLLMMAAGIYSISEFAITAANNSEPVNIKLKAEWLKIKDQISLYIAEDEGDSGEEESSDTVEEIHLNARTEMQGDTV
ncbi:MAG: hypothetical protein HOD92_06650 [Deltaproteobacteria bacterium]|jgi:hypothetical protein|nr:hypothetical protein [Deltaproteobacteria bacterium]